VSGSGWGSCSVSVPFSRLKRRRPAGHLSFKPLEEFLDPADVATVGEGCYSEGEVVHIREHQTPRDPETQWQHVEKKEELGDR